VLDARHVEDGGVVHEDVEVAELAEGEVDDVLPRRFARHVVDDGPRASTEVCAGALVVVTALNEYFARQPKSLSI